MADLDSELAQAERRFGSLYAEFGSKLDREKDSRRASSQAALSKLDGLHLSQDIRREILQAVKDENEDIVADFLREQGKKPPPPPPPFPPPASLLRTSPSISSPAAANTTNTNESVDSKVLLSRMTAQARISLLGKDREIARLRRLVDQQHNELDRERHWREVATQYGRILVSGVRNVAINVNADTDTDLSHEHKMPEQQSLARLCDSFSSHLTRGESFGSANVVAKSQPASISGVVLNSVFATIGESEQETSEEESKLCWDAPAQFLHLPTTDEEMSESLFALFVAVQREWNAASGHVFIGRKGFLLSCFLVNLYDSNSTFSLVERAFDRAAMSSSRGQSKFSARLELNDFISALALIAAVKYPASDADAASHSPSRSTATPLLHRLLSFLTQTATPFLDNAALRRRWIENCAPLVANSVWPKLVQYESVIYSVYIRSKRYGLMPRSTSIEAGDVDLYDEEKAGREARQERKRLHQLGSPTETSSRRQLLARPLRKSLPPNSPQLPSSPGVTSPRLSSRPTHKSEGRARSNSLTSFETFCANVGVVPLVATATTARRISQYIKRLEGTSTGGVSGTSDNDTFRGFVACLTYLAIVMAQPRTDASPHCGQSATHDVSEERQQRGFEEAIDRVIALVDAGVLAALAPFSLSSCGW